VAELAVVEKVEERIGATWSPAAGGFVLPVISPNTASEPPTEGPFITLQFPVASSGHVGLAGVGNRTFLEDGAFRIVLAYPKGAGVNEALQWMRELRALFRAWQSGDLKTYDPSPPIDNDANDDGNYYVLSTSVPYEYDLRA
jgi:hypothetical protein